MRTKQHQAVRPSLLKFNKYASIKAAKHCYIRKYHYLCTTISIINIKSNFINFKLNFLKIYVRFKERTAVGRLQLGRV